MAQGIGAQHTPSKLLVFLMATIYPLILSGCGAHFNSIYRSRVVDDKELVISQDAKQRVLLRLERVGKSGQIITCAEPQPDALTVHAATGSGDITLPKGLSAGASGASAESGANIGLRTQTITLLRDQGYRVCEGYINGAVSELDYAQLLRRNQVMLTAVLAIEQLTGAVVGPSAAIGASSSLTVDREAVQKATTELADKEKKLGEQETVVKNKQQVVEDQEKKLEALKEESAPEEQVEQARKDLEAKRRDLADAEATLEGARRATAIARQGLANAQTPNLTTGTSSNLQGATVATKDIPSVATAVRDIVKMAFEKSHLLDLCQIYWTGGVKNVNKYSTATDVDYPNMLKVCDSLFKKFLTTLGESPAPTIWRGEKGQEDDSRHLFEAPTDLEVNP